MARVVQRRSTPPYLLIIVFFLFLVATTLAVMQYMSADEANNSDAKSTKLIRSLASPSELQNSQIQDMIQKYNTSRSGEPLTVLTQFSNQVKELTKAKLLDTNTCWAPLALSDGKLFIRDQKQMKCVAVK